jgi:hypothetical protein
MSDYTDISGILRRPGSLIMPQGTVSSFPPTASDPDFPMWDDATIKRVISDPNRRDMVKLFPFAQYGTNQHSTSACNGFAGASAVTRVRKLRGIDDGFVGSGSFVYSSINRGQDNGSVLEDGMKAIQEHGVCDQKLNPYDRIFAKQVTPDARADALKHKGLSAYRATSREAWNSGLAAGFVGVAAVMCGPRFDKITNLTAGVQQGPGNHAMCVESVEWRNGEYQYLSVQSWGNGYGSNGRVYLTWNHFRETFGSHTFYLLPTSVEG